MAERNTGLPIDAAGQAISDGRDSLQTPTNLSENSINLIEDEADFLRKKQQLDAATPDFFAEYQEMPKIIVVESIGLPNNDFGRRGC